MLLSSDRQFVDSDSYVPDSNSESDAYDVTALKWEVLPQVHVLAKKNAGYVVRRLYSMMQRWK